MIGLPEGYQPGGTYTLSVGLARPGTALGGFQLTARTADGPDAGRQAGRLDRIDDRVNLTDTTLARVGAVTYARHTRAGAEPAEGGFSWVLRWTAPAAGTGTVIFHVVANASNGDDSPLSDYIYTHTLRTAAAP